MDVWERMRSSEDRLWKIRFIDGHVYDLIGHFEFDPLGRPLFLQTTAGPIWLYSSMTMIAEN